MKRGVLGALALLLTCLAVPAHAASANGSVTGINGVLYDDCRAYPYRYSVVQPAGAAYWDLVVALYGPGGRQVGSDLVTAPATGTSTFSPDLCPPTNRYGAYTIRATVRWGADIDHVDHSSPLDPATFTLRKPRTRTALTVSTHRPAYGQRVTYRIRVWDERPAGYLPTAFAWVVLQRKVDGHWVRIRDSRTLTHDTGRVRLRIRYLQHHERMRIRAVAQASDRYARSASPVVRLW